MMKNKFFEKELKRMSKKYKRKPLKDIELKIPEDLNPLNPMYEMYEKKTTLLQQGEIVYACIVQANNYLFSSTPAQDYPALILYSKNPYFTKNMEFIYDFANDIYSYKGRDLDTIPDKWKEISKAVTDEFDCTGYTFSLNLGGHSTQCHMIATMIHRELLPEGRLCGKIFPVLTTPDCKQVFILPQKYWSKKFKKAWVKGELN